MKNKDECKFIFPVGYHSFNNRQIFNFQLNRWHSLGYLPFDDLSIAGTKILNFADWKREMLNLAEVSESRDKFLQAAFYYRAAEFYLLVDTPEKEKFFDKFSALFYQATSDENIERFNVPYGDVFLPAMRIPAVGKSKSVIVMHGGFDSFIEEFYSEMKFFSEQGYEVIAFEGPGQGAARRKYGLAFDIEWEKPVKAVLDYFNLTNVTLYGISMGGWLCMRAAALEPRIVRVIATGHAIDYMKSMHPILQYIHLWFIKHCRGFVNRMAEKKFQGDNVQSWMVNHLMYISKKDKPMDALEIYLALNEDNIHSELVKQDVLILNGSEDHFVPVKMHRMQMDALTSAKSVTGKVFTRDEHAQNHCQMGNIGLALEVMVKWMDEKSQVRNS